MEKDKIFDVIIIGGSYAGLSAAMSLGRSLKQTLVIDSGNPCNQKTPHSHNFLTQDGNTPKEISSLAKQQVEHYASVHFFEGFASEGVKNGNQFEVKTQSGHSFLGKKLIFASGIKDIMPDIKGFSDCWGKTVIHCPYCHGYEFKGKKTGIFVQGDRAFHLASLVNNLTNELTILTSGPASFSSEQSLMLKKHNIIVDEREIAEIEHQNGQMQKVVFQNGEKLDLDALYAAVPFQQHSQIPMDLGCELNEQGYIKTDMLQRTTVEEVYACGDNSSPMRSVANAVHFGNFTGAVVNKELTEALFN